jgi:hypothetical protein
MRNLYAMLIGCSMLVTLSSTNAQQTQNPFPVAARG